jgi:hypothetical protein
LLSIDRSRDAKVDEAPEGATSRTRRTDQIRRVVTGNKRRSIAVLAASMLLGSTGIALAGPTGSIVAPPAGEPQNTGGLIKYGPINPDTGFPDWYRDKTGTLDLEGCIDARDPYCNAPPVPNPDAAPTFPDNFPDEFFYMLADANLTAAGGNTVLAEYAVEGAFAAGPPVAGDQMVFGRTRYRIRGGLNDQVTYKITNPYGVDYVKPDAGATDLFVTEDAGASAGSFGAVFGGQVGPFLKWDGTAPAAPKGYIGDPATPHSVTGGINGQNLVRIEGKGIGGGAGETNPNPCVFSSATVKAYSGPVNDCIETVQFSLTGKLSTRGGVDVARATYSRDANGIQFDAMAGSKATQDILVQDTAATRRFPATKLAADGERYFAHVKVTGTDVPATVDVVNNSDVPHTVKHVPLVDLVTGTADYDTGTGQITVKAKSSDTGATTTLSLPDYPGVTFDATGTATIKTAVPADTVKVASSAKGAGVIPVTVSGTTTTAPVTLKADAGPDQPNVTSGTSVTLDGSSSTGNIDGYAWTPVTAGAPALTGADGAKPTFTASNTGTTPVTYTYKLTVTSTASAATDPPATDTVDVTIQPGSAALTPKISVNGGVATAATATIPQNLPVTLDAGSSTNAGQFLWVVPQGGGPGFPAGTVVNGPKLTFTFPKTSAMVVKLIVTKPGVAAPTAQCDLNGAARCKSVTVVLNGEPDTLASTKARYVPASARWVVTGTATSTKSNNVHVYSGNTIIESRKIGSSPVAADGTWAVDVRDSAIPVTAPCECVTVVSDRGGESHFTIDKTVPTAGLPASNVAGPKTTVVPGATVLPAPTVAAAATRTVASVPLAGAAVTVAALAPANVTVAPTVTGGTVAAAGLGVTVNVPNGITLLQVRVLASNGKPLFNVFQMVSPGKKAKIKIRSAKLRRSLKSGKRYQLEVRAGTSRANLGKPVVKQFRVKR